MRKYLLLLPLCLFIANSTLAQHRIGFSSTLHNSEYIPGIQFEFELSQKWSVSANGSYYFNNDRWYGPDSSPYRRSRGYMEIRTPERTSGYGLGVGVFRSGFIIKNLVLDARLNYSIRNTKTLIPEYFSTFFDVNYVDLGFSNNRTARSLNPTIGLGYTIQMTDQFFVRPYFSIGKDFILNEVEGHKIEDERTHSFGIQIGTSF
ncbi:MAG: hypothetical protein ED557_08780 [Balneola sp.]|nr:MAG: hypothetical protein ED557_08780 [Balneola sp.]